MKDNELLLIDLSSLAHPIWHMAGNEPDPNHVSTQVVARVRALATEHPHAAVCCDSGKSFRCEIDPTYKAQRPEPIAPLQHQIKLAREILVKDGFPVWAVKGFEADDIIATATAQALAIDGTTVLIASADKDLLQLINGRVTAKSLTNGNILDEAAVVEKFKVKPSQMLDYLSLVGDTSDNVKGASGIGGVRASALLAKYGSLDGVYAAIDRGATFDITPAQRTSLQEFRARKDTVRRLIALRTDVTIPFEEIAAERVPQDSNAPSAFEDEPAQQENADDGIREAGNDPQDGAHAEHGGAGATSAVAANIGQVPAGSGTAGRRETGNGGSGRDASMPGDSTREVVREVARTDLIPVDRDWQLEPRTLDEAKVLAKYAFESRLFSAYGTPQAVLMVIMAGRDLGLSAMASLRGFHLVEGKPTLSADLIRALVIKSGRAKFFRPIERTPTRATWETQRGDDPPVSLTFTIEEAQAAGVVRKGSGWEKFPSDMLTARASAKLARLVYSDIVFNLYDPSELG